MHHQLNNEHCHFCGQDVKKEIVEKQTPGWVGYVCKNKKHCETRTYLKISEMVKTTLTKGV